MQCLLLFRSEWMILGIILYMGYQINDTGRLFEKEYNKKQKKRKRDKQKVKQCRDDREV